MPEYLITDPDGSPHWTAAASIREALIARVNAGREAAGLPGLHPTKTRVSHYSEGSRIDVSLADYSCRGLEGWVVRPDPTEVMLADLAAWEVFAEANREALIAEHGSVDEALRLVREGGLEMGGGAAPLVVVYFADGEAV